MGNNNEQISSPDSKFSYNLKKEIVKLKDRVQQQDTGLVLSSIVDMNMSGNEEIEKLEDEERKDFFKLKADALFLLVEDGFKNMEQYIEGKSVLEYQGADGFINKIQKRIAEAENCLENVDQEDGKPIQAKIEEFKKRLADLEPQARYKEAELAIGPLIQFVDTRNIPSPFEAIIRKIKDKFEVAEKSGADIAKLRQKVVELKKQLPMYKEYFEGLV
jgi:polyhydroxyalkanoate synthesis regulator phasin